MADDKITTRAKEIIANGEAFEHLYEIWQKMHYGDKFIGKSLLISIPCITITNSRGIHIDVKGEHGTGKTHALTCALKLLPKAQIFSGGISPKFLYGSDVKPGTILFIDEIVWNGDPEGLGQTVKRITSKFQEGDERGTKDGIDSAKQKAPERLVFWVSSVDSQGDEQIRDRFISHTTVSDSKHVEEIKTFMKKQDAGKEEVIVTEEELHICKAIIREVCGNLTEVVIPYAERIDISGDTRAQVMFMDMIRSFAMYNCTTRQKDDKGRLIATEDDFKAAKELYMGLGGHDPDKFTETETKVIEAILVIQKAGKDATISLIQEETGLSQPRVYYALYGRKTSKGEPQGLIHKCKDLQVSGIYSKVYKLPADYNPKLDVSISLRAEWEDDIRQEIITPGNAGAAPASA